MANEEHLKILKQGVEAWNKWRKANPEVVPNLSGVDLSKANLRSANLSEADLSGADLQQSQLNRARLLMANLSKSNLAGSDLSEANLVSADLSMADLSDAILFEARLSDANLWQANLSRADLTRANLSGAYLRSAHLRGGNLSQAVLHGADFQSAMLAGASLVGAYVRKVDFTGAILAGVSLGYTALADVDLSRLKGIETIDHRAPSTIGIDTIYRSHGKIPAQFLRDVGVPDNFIEYMSSLVGTAFEFYSCFISYSSIDQEFADRLYADLQREGVRCWFAPHHVQAGKKLHEQIDTAIRLHERLLLILSPESINSEWVKTEIAKARAREIKESKRVLFPVRLNISFEELQEWECFDADRGKDSAREIREYYIPDFTRWKDHDQYQEEFRKLLRDLKKGDASAVGA